MKRIFLIAALFCTSIIVLQSCSPKTMSGNMATKRGDVSGNWMVNDITFDGIPEIAVQSYLGETSYKCFIGSTWNLTNSGNGSYSLPQSATCAAKTQTIFWSVNPANETFQYKKIYEGEKPRNVVDGHVFTLVSSDGMNMVVKSPIDYSNKTAYIVMKFTKASN